MNSHFSDNLDYNLLSSKYLPLAYKEELNTFLLFTEKITLHHRREKEEN